jgi:hypothetical protein
MDERYLTELYHKYGGQNTFGSYQAFYNKVQNDAAYRAKLHTFIGGEKGSGKSYSDFESSVKKKEGTGPSLPYGSSQTQPSSGSEPSQEDSGFDGFKWAKEKAEKGKAALQPESYSEAIKQAEEGKKPTSELGLEGALDIKGPDITAVSESTKPFINPQFNIVTSKKETLPSTETSLKYLPTKEEKILIRRENENKKKQEIEDRRIENSEYNRANDEFFNTYFSSGIENYDSELAKLEADKQLGVYNGYEENYKNRKSELNAARGNAYNQILDKYINDILKNDNNKDFLEIKERYDGIMNDIRKAGFNSFEELQSKYGDVPIESGDPSDSPIFDIVDKADQRFLRQLRIDAINQLEVPDPNRENKYIEGLGYMNKSIDAVSKFHKQAQPIYADYDNLMKDINTFEADFKSGKYGEKEANDIKNSLQSREKEILTRTNQLKKESGLTDYDIARYELAGKKQFVLGSNYENSFSSLKQIDKVQAEEIANRQRWVTENPVLGSMAYFIPAAYQSFSNATVLETARFAKPISELAGFEGYGWTDALYYGVTEYQKDRDYLYGYTGQDIDGDGQVDDLPGFAKYANILAQGLGSVASFAIPGTYAKNLFPGLGAGAKAGRFATNWTGAFLMSEGPAYEEAKRSGLSNEEAARSATLIAALQATAEQIVPDIKYLDPSLTKAGFISLIKAGYTGNELFKKGMSYLYDYSKSVSKSSLKEGGEEIVGQFGTDLGKEATNALYTNSNNYNLSSFSNPDYSTKVYDDAWQMKNYVDAGIGGLLTGGFLDGFRNATRVYTQNEMEALSYMGQNWKDILYNIERTESNGVNRGDDRFKQIEGELKGIGDLYSALKGTPGFSELTKANQDMVMSLAYRKRTLEDNAKKLGVTLPSVEESIKGIESRMNDYLTGKLDYGADKPVVYMDDKLAEIGVATVNVNPDGTYDIVPKDLPGLSKEEIIKNADSYIKNSLKDEGFQKIFLHPKTENYAIQESETGQVPVQPEAAVGEQVEEGTSQTEPQVTTEEGGKKEVGSDVLNRTLDVVDKVETKIEKSEPINDEDRKQAEDSLYELLNDIDSNPNLSTEQKAQMSLPIENKLQKIQDYELGTRTETRTTTQAVATGTTPKTQTKNERATIPLRTAAEESIDVTYNGRAGKLKIDQGNYVFVPNKIGRQQPKSVVIGEAAVTNRDSKFAGVESVNKKGVTTSAQITLPNGAVLGIMDTDLSIDIGIEIAKQEVGPAPQALFDVVFDEIVSENNVEIPYTKAAPKVEAAQVEEVQPEPETPQAAQTDLGTQLLEANEYTNKRKNELLKKYKSDSKKRNLISSASVAIEAIKKIYPDLKVYLHENTEEYELATEAQGIKLSEAGAMIFDNNGNVIGVHVDLSKADGTTTPHELTHAILAKAFGDNPVLFKEFKDRVEKLLSESTNKELNDFANQYEGDVKSEEYLVQLAAVLTDNRDKIEPSILQKLMTLINNFVSRITKGNVVPFKSNAKTQALVDFFNSVALTMSTGRDISGLQANISNLQGRFAQKPSKPTATESEGVGVREQSKRISDAQTYRKYYMPNVMGGVLEMTPQNYLEALKELLSTGGIENLNKYSPKELTEKQFPLSETNAQNPTFIKTNYDGWEKSVQFDIDGVEDRMSKSKEQKKQVLGVEAKQQIVGERGIKNANDKVAQKDLETAKLMASNNRPSTDIKRATGWEMGADGEWRYEYPNVTLKDDLQDENDFRLVVKGYNQSQGISDRFETKPPAIPLSEILNFGELQKAYPYIEDLYFELDDSLQSEAFGQLDIGRGLVSLNPKIIDQIGIGEVQKVFVHEIQHYIQDQEGFEKGGNVEMFEYKINNSKDAYKIPGLKLINDYNVQDTIEFGIYDLKNLVEEGVDLMSIYKGKYNKREYTGNPQALLKAAFRPDQIQNLDLNDVESAVSKIENYVVYSAAHKDYWNMVGETEARNAAKRSETPYLERLYGETLESTEDVLRRDQIRKDGGKIFKEMDVVSNKRGLARQRMEQQNRENFGELYMKAKEINDNFETIINQLGITKICGL